jgi:hypothetical protein
MKLKQIIQIINTDAKVLLWLSAIAFLFFGFAVFLPFFSDDFVIFNLDLSSIKAWSTRSLSIILLYVATLLFGKTAAYYHFILLIIHTVNSWLVYKVLCKIGTYYTHSNQANKSIALLCATLFCLYPYHTESFIWVVGNASLLASLFVLLSFYFYLKSSKKSYFYVSVFFYSLSVFCYESVFLFPLVLMLIERIHLKKTNLTTLFYFIPNAVIIAYNLGIHGSLSGNSYLQMFANEQLLVFKYIKLVYHLILPPCVPYFKVSFCFSVVSLLLILIACFRLFSIKKAAYFLLFFMLISCPIVFIPTNYNQLDSGRLLYYPAIFIVLFLQYIFNTISNKYLKYALAISLIVSFVSVNYTSKQLWQAGGDLVYQYEKIVASSECKHYIAVDVPDEIHGICVLRNRSYEYVNLYHLGATHTLQSLFNVRPNSIQDLKLYQVKIDKQSADTCHIQFVYQ